MPRNTSDTGTFQRDFFPPPTNANSEKSLVCFCTANPQLPSRLFKVLSWAHTLVHQLSKWPKEPIIYQEQNRHLGEYIIIFVWFVILSQMGLAAQFKATWERERGSRLSKEASKSCIYHKQFFLPSSVHLRVLKIKKTFIIWVGFTGKKKKYKK